MDVVDGSIVFYVCFCFFFQAEDGIRDLVRSRGLGDVYKRQIAPYTIEEAYEVADAIEKQDSAGLRDELGDLLFLSLIHI